MMQCEINENKIIYYLFKNKKLNLNGEYDAIKS